MRTIVDSFKRQKPMVRGLIACTVVAGMLMLLMGISEDDVRLRETGIMLSVVLPIIGLLEDRIYRKSRERYLETKAAAEQQHKRSLPARQQSSETSGATQMHDAIEWYGLYG